MDGSHPRAPELPDVFPVFPLTGALLLPHGRLPLNIFEQRYLAMVEDSLGQGRMFGMIQPDPTHASGPTGPALFRVGCLGRLVSFSETDDGRNLITLHGVIRFRVIEEAGMHRGYRRVRGDFTPFMDDLDSRSHSIGGTRKAIEKALYDYFTARGLDANWDAIAEIPDEALVATISMVCPFDPAEKQALLEAPTAADRAQSLIALLEMGLHDQGDDTAGRTLS
jgi:Lon protease-like protein